MGMDMDKLLQQVGQMQEEMQKAQDELANETVEATAGGGMVTVTANGGRQSIQAIPSCSRTWSSPPSTRRSARPAA